MAKLDVGVGDEFPTGEIRRDENGVIHHHHYYARRRRPFGLLRLVLVIILIGLVVRMFHYASWLDIDWSWMPGYVPFAGTLTAIGVVAVLLYLLRRHDYKDRH